MQTMPDINELVVFITHAGWVMGYYKGTQVDGTVIVEKPMLVQAHMPPGSDKGLILLLLINLPIEENELLFLKGVIGWFRPNKQSVAEYIRRTTGLEIPDQSKIVNPPKVS